MPKRKFTDDQEQTICARYLAGETTVQLGKAYGVHRGTIGKALRRNDIKPRDCNSGRSLCAEDVVEVCSRYQAGDSSLQIAKDFGVTPQGVRLYLRRSGVRLRGNSEARGGIPASLEREVCDRYTAGESLYQLGKAFGVSTHPIAVILERNGIERRRPGGYGDSIQHVLDCTGYHLRPRECELYLCKIASHPKTHCKIGIAYELESRIRHHREIYGEAVLRLYFANRTEAYLLEQAVLDASRCHANYPCHLLGWAGASEVRSVPASDLEPVLLRLADELDELGPWAFAAAYVPMTAAQRAVCQQRASVNTPLSSFS